MRDIIDYASKYINEPFEDTIVEIRKKLVIKQCKKYAHRNILEVGCGISPLFRDYKDFDHMVIVEPSGEFVRNAQELVKRECLDDKVSIYNGFAEDISEEIKKAEEEFDFIIISSLLHEVEDPKRLLSGIRSLCADHTMVHINVPNANSLHRLIAFENGMIADIHEQSAQQILMQRHRTYDMQLLVKEVSDAGFCIEDNGSYFIKPFTHTQMQKCLDAGIIDGHVLEGLEKLVKYLPEFGAEIYINCRKGRF